jgi:hypothetical protein
MMTDVTHASRPRTANLPRLCALLAAGFVSACLPEGEPGIGERWIETRGITILAVPSGDAGSPFVVFGRRAQANTEYFKPNDIFSLAGAGAPPRLLASNSLVFEGGLTWDARDRLWLMKFATGMPDFTGAQGLRIDIATGDATPLGQVQQIQVAPDGKTILLGRSTAGAEVRDLDDHAQPLGSGVGVSAFVGSTLFFTTPEGLHQIALPPFGPPRLLVPKVRRFWRLPGQPVLLLDIALKDDPGDRYPERQISLLRTDDMPAAPQPIPLARGHFSADPVASDDGDRIALLDRTEAPDQARVRIVDLATGVEEAAIFTGRPQPIDPRSPSLPPGAPIGYVTHVVFRPHTSELWIFQSGNLAGIFADGVLRPIAETEQQADDSGFFASPLDPGRETFTSDGRHWMFRGGDGKVRMGDANAPESPDGLVVADPGNSRVISYQEVDEGRRLLVFSDQGEDRDLDLADLEEGRIVHLGSHVGDARIGSARVIAIVDKLSDGEAPGRLVLIDLRTGARTRLGDNVVAFRLDPVCATCDRTAPGVGLQYVVQARLPYRHDGLWKATLP